MAAVPEFIPISKGKEMFAMSSWRDSTAPRAQNKDGCAATNVFSLQNASSNSAGAPAAEDAAARKNGDSTKGGKRSSNGGGRSRRGGRGSAKEVEPQVPDVEDYFVHIIFPNEVPYKSVEFDLFAKVIPLKMINVGPLRFFFQRRSRAAGGEAEAGKESDAKAPPAKEKPAVPQYGSVSPLVVPDPEEGPGGLPPAISLPPAELTTGGATGNIPEGNAYQVSLLFAERAEAVDLEAFVTKRWPMATVSVLPRSRNVLNTSLVLKCLPSLNKTEQIIEELQQLPHRTSYVRLLRSERGVFKNVIFVKYPNCEAAEETKLRLERFVIGARQLKVEFKKKWKTTRCNDGSNRVENDDASGNGGSAGGPADAFSSMSLQQLVRDIRVSSVHEGFFYNRSDLSKENIKLLKQLCHSYGLLFTMTEERVTVKRQLGVSAMVSPAMKPAAVASTPNWVPLTPAPLRPMDFKGISHWKDIRSQQNMLGIIRPLGPDDKVQPFSAGRGRPV